MTGRALAPTVGAPVIMVVTIGMVVGWAAQNPTPISPTRPGGLLMIHPLRIVVLKAGFISTVDHGQQLPTLLTNARVETDVEPDGIAVLKDQLIER